jgi:hypothetical protein
VGEKAVAHLATPARITVLIRWLRRNSAIPAQPLRVAPQLQLVPEQQNDPITSDDCAALWNYWSKTIEVFTFSPTALSSPPISD